MVAIEEHAEPRAAEGKSPAVDLTPKADHRIVVHPRPRVTPSVAPPSDFSVSEEEKEDFLARRAVSGALQNPAMNQNIKDDNETVSQSRPSPAPSSTPGAAMRQPLHRPTISPKPAPIAQVARKPGYGNAVPTAPPGLQEAVAQLKAAESSTHPVAKSVDASAVAPRPAIVPRPVSPAREQNTPAPTASNGTGRAMPFNRPNFSATRK